MATTEDCEQFRASAVYVVDCFGPNYLLIVIRFFPNDEYLLIVIRFFPNDEHLAAAQLSQDIPEKFHREDLEEKVTNHGVSAESKRMCEPNEYFQSPEEEKMKPYAEYISKIMRSEQLLSPKLQPTTLCTLDPQPATSSHLWILDSGATDHICGSQPLFKALHPFNGGITLADGSSTPITGIGDVRLSDNLTLKDVLYAEGFPYNLISVSALTQQHHYAVTFMPDYYVIKDLYGQTIGRGPQSGNLYMLDSSNLFSFPP